LLALITFITSNPIEIRKVFRSSITKSVLEKNTRKPVFNQY